MKTGFRRNFCSSIRSWRKPETERYRNSNIELKLADITDSTAAGKPNDLKTFNVFRSEPD